MGSKSLHIPTSEAHNIVGLLVADSNNRLRSWEERASLPRISTSRADILMGWAGKA